MKKISDLPKEMGIENCILMDYCPIKLGGKNRVNILALGDVGTTVLMGLRLLGADVISSIGICDIVDANNRRLEQEINQINYPFGLGEMPKVDIVSMDKLFNCDVLVFCASKGVPPVGAQGDVRMAQLRANRKIVENYGKLAKEKNYKGLICMVSDPVDPLCKVLLKSSELNISQIQGYGLGVMNTRAMYYADMFKKFASYNEEGRAFGPHGKELVIANSIKNYDDEISKILTEFVVRANVRIRDLGYKPYLAPAISSAAISIILTLRGQWHYGSLYMGDDTSGAFLGIKNRMVETGPEYENLSVDDKLFARILKAYKKLCNTK